MNVTAYANECHLGGLHITAAMWRALENLVNPKDTLVLHLDCISHIHVGIADFLKYSIFRPSILGLHTELKRGARPAHELDSRDLLRPQFHREVRAGAIS